jgi:hypothetical protein
MRANDNTRAEALLSAVLTSTPAPSRRLAAAATLDLARLAHLRRDFPRALLLVERVLAADADPNLVVAARRLRCKIQRSLGLTCAER